MAKYHVLWEAEFEADEEWAQEVVDRRSGHYFGGEESLPGDTLIVTKVEEPMKLPTAVGSIIGTSKPWVVLHSDGRWHSVKATGASYTSPELQFELDTGIAHYKVLYDAGKVAE